MEGDDEGEIFKGDWCNRKRRQVAVLCCVMGACGLCNVRIWIQIFIALILEFDPLLFLILLGDQTEVEGEHNGETSYHATCVPIDFSDQSPFTISPSSQDLWLSHWSSFCLIRFRYVLFKNKK